MKRQVRYLLVTSTVAPRHRGVDSGVEATSARARQMLA